MKMLNLLGIFFSLIAVVAFSYDGIHGTEAIGVAFNFVLIGINYSLWRINNGGYIGVWAIINPLIFVTLTNLVLFNFLGGIS